MYQSILEFWFSDNTKPYWFKKSASFDKRLSTQYSELLFQAKLGELASWRNSAQGRLSEIIVLDQFSRNIYRDSEKAFEADAQALALAQEAVQQNVLDELNAGERNFMLMPFMHSESLLVHTQAEALFKQYADAATIQYEQAHKDIITRFGRYPHRNALLQRQSTPEESLFLTEKGSHF